MKFSRFPPGEDIQADAYNLIVAASIGQANPDIAERMVRNITRRVTDWESLSAHLALVGAKLAVTDPETVRIAIDSRHPSSVHGRQRGHVTVVPHSG